ncbi:hypothetical protein BKA66DRAFT_394299, partial [Pyrenochaeta sp. MPI-SDFR-AT-0127]
YACLSHRWAPTLPPRSLLKKLLDSHQRDILFELLLPTFQNAVLVCRGLQTSYLWTDSLCILQGDNDGKAKGISQMSAIYANRVVVLA